MTQQTQDQIQEHPVSKKTRGILWFAQLFILIAAIGISVMRHNSFLPPLSFDTLSTEEKDDFNGIRFDMDFTELEHHLIDFYPMTHTPYIFVRLYKHNWWQKADIQQRYHKILILNREREKMILHAGWKNFHDTHNARYNPHSSVYPLGIYTAGNHPRLLFERSAYLIPDSFQSFSFLPKSLLHAIINPQKETWSVDLQGNLQKMKNLDHFVFKRENTRPADFSKITGLNSKLLYEYEISDGEFKETHHWPELSTSYEPIFHLPNKGYLLNQRKKESPSIVFLYPNHPQITKFTFKSLFERLPGPPKTRRYSNVIPLSITDNKTILAYIETPSYPIFEFDPGQFAQESFEKKVRFVGYGGKLQPLLAFDRNQSILFKEHIGSDLSFSHIGVFSGMRLFTVKTESLPSREIELPTGEIKCYEFPFFSRFSTTPIDDSHLLAYGEKTFWSFKWDGSEVEQIFPRSPSLNLPPALPETPAILSKPVLDPRITYKNPTPKINVNPFQGLINELNKQKPSPPYPLPADDGLKN